MADNARVRTVRMYCAVGPCTQRLDKGPMLEREQCCLTCRRLKGCDYFCKQAPNCPNSLTRDRLLWRKILGREKRVCKEVL